MHKPIATYDVQKKTDFTDLLNEDAWQKDLMQSGKLQFESLQVDEKSLEIVAQLLSFLYKADLDI